MYLPAEVATAEIDLLRSTPPPEPHRPSCQRFLPAGCAGVRDELGRAMAPAAPSRPRYPRFPVQDSCTCQGGRDSRPLRHQRVEAARSELAEWIRVGSLRCIRCIVGVVPRCRVPRLRIWWIEKDSHLRFWIPQSLCVVVARDMRRRLQAAGTRPRYLSLRGLGAS